MGDFTMKRHVKKGSRRARRRAHAESSTPRVDQVSNKVFELPSSPDALLTSAQVAALLGLKTEATLAVWRSTKRYALPYVKLGAGIVRYRRADVEAFVESRVCGAKAA